MLISINGISLSRSIKTIGHYINQFTIINEFNTIRIDSVDNSFELHLLPFITGDLVLEEDMLDLLSMLAVDKLASELILSLVLCFRSLAMSSILLEDFD